MNSKKRNPAVGRGGARNVDCLEAVSSDIIPPKQDLQPSLPSRATLARRWPGLKVNRFSGRWRDDATGVKGDNVDSLLAFLNAGGRK